MGAGCAVTCRSRCKQKVSPEQRLAVFQQFQSCDVTGQREYILRHISGKVPERRTGQNARRQRKQQFTYSFTIEDEVVNVCQTYFTATLGISTTVIRTALQKKNDVGMLESERRGKHGKQKRIDDSIRNQIRDHINLFPRVEAHYVRKDSKRQYLQQSLTLSKMYKLYQDWCAENRFEVAKFWLYEDIFYDEFNLGFHVPKKDQCLPCTEYKNADENQKQELEERHNEHLENKEHVRENKMADKEKAVKDMKDKDNQFSAAVFDMQAVLPCPNGNTSIFFYKRKLSVHNFTIYDLAPKQGHCNMWDETEAGRGANEIASCLYIYLKEKAEKGYKEIAFYSDGCGAQNRNRFLYTMYLYIVATTTIQSITHQYLESGHSQNEGDSMHSAIERAVRGVDIYIPEDYYAIVRACNGNYSFKNLTQDTCIDFKAFALDQKLGYNWKNKDNNGEAVRWSKIKQLHVNDSEENTLFIKYQHSDAGWNKVVLAKKRRRAAANRYIGNIANAELLSAYSGPRKIAEEKLKDLLALRDAVVPSRYHHFYNKFVTDDESEAAAVDGSDSDDS